METEYNQEELLGKQAGVWTRKELSIPPGPEPQVSGEDLSKKGVLS